MAYEGFIEQRRINILNAFLETEEGKEILRKSEISRNRGHYIEIYLNFDYANNRYVLSCASVCERDGFQTYSPLKAFIRDSEKFVDITVIDGKTVRENGGKYPPLKTNGETIELINNSIKDRKGKSYQVAQSQVDNSRHMVLCKNIGTSIANRLLHASNS